jgi:16S rRNA (cytosine1402-N4)-methyltransferase
MELHKPVLRQEVLHYLAIQADGIYCDGTFGRGGHTQAILQQLGSLGRLFAMDKDQQAVAYAQQVINDPRFAIKQGSFTGLQAWMQEVSLVGKIDGILLDLGVSSPQLDDPERGFSFMREGPLDMRMDRDAGISAARWLSDASEATIIQVLHDYGEERYARRIAKAIVDARCKQAITTTKQLADIVADAHPRWQPGKHPATRTFQAIRIEINQELTELLPTLEQCYQCLKVGGRLLVISFHSLEHRQVKKFLRQRIEKKPGNGSMRSSKTIARIKEIAKVYPQRIEMKNNPCARSAMLRVGEKIQ